MRRLTAGCLAVLGLLALSTSLLDAANWPNWRGPASNGIAPGRNFPIEWSSSEHVLWKVDLPGKGASTPVVWDEKIVVTCGVEGHNSVVCLDFNGQKLWQTPVGDEIPGKHNKATGANPSAATDGKHWYVYFKSGDLACLDFHGAIVWQKNLQDLYGKDTLWWDLGTSPVLTRDNVVVAAMHSGPSYLAAFDKTDGKLAWKVDRNLDAPSEAAQSYSTPIVTTENGKEILVVLGADHVTAHAAADGKELWRVGGLNPTGHQYFRSIASPVVCDGIVVAPYARGDSLTAIRLGGSGDVTKTHVVWRKDKLGSDVPTPAAADGKVYILGDKGALTCLEAKTGDELWSSQSERHRTGFTSSPILADGKLYLTREDGKTFVVLPGKEAKVLAANELEDEFVVATPVLVDGRILIRTRERLYCIGN